MEQTTETKTTTACFTGHRKLKKPIPEIERKLTDIVEDLIQRGYRYFETGGARGFDALAAEVVLKLKERHPQIELIIVLPFDEQYELEEDWSEAEKAQYHSLKERASKVLILESGYKRGIYYKRNRYLIDTSSVCIAYMTRVKSGTGYTVKYAQENNVDVINVAKG